MGGLRNLFLFPQPPADEMMKALPQAQIELDLGYTPVEAALTAKRSDVVITFGIRLEGEGFDLPWACQGQDAVIDAVG